MQYIISIGIALGIIVIWQVVVFLYKKNIKLGIKIGTNQAVNQIFNYIKNSGEFKIILDGIEMIIIEKVAKIKTKEKK